MAILLTPGAVMWSLLAAVLVVVAMIGMHRHHDAERKWQNAHQRMVSINRVEEGGLAPELSNVAKLVSSLEKKLHEIERAYGGGNEQDSLFHNASASGGDHTKGTKDAAQGSSATLPYARPRRPLVAVARIGEGGSPASLSSGRSIARRLVDNGVENTIFVSIASYRDEQCAPTVLDMYQRAKKPHTIFVGAVEQHFPQDPSCIPKEFENCQASLDFCPTDHIQVRRIPPNKARGPTFGRFYGMLMYRGETFLFMMDSHNRFVTHWDHIIVKMYQGLPTAKGVLSHYPEAWNNPQDGEATNAPLDSRI
ncbi:glycosyltransferase (GlcNAc), putative [Bodo saltans]|uniref:Glycosyltransferase (GlcNAc), putative n=1 Tax=Bodo saltans TaxID=75058 RepID=A0A0S4J5I1_BODSA|nr:glycosyltransferase (GlcNAc), putative [Bodo saltans]|eukprot:CUG86699.1 glycosyltransferase (GlcNAc), putative [Bodo saltans]